MFQPNIIKLSQTVWELWPAQDFGFRGDKCLTKKVRVVSLAHDTPTGPLLLFLTNMKAIHRRIMANYNFEKRLTKR